MQYWFGTNRSSADKTRVMGNKLDALGLSDINIEFYVAKTRELVDELLKEGK